MITVCKVRHAPAGAFYVGRKMPRWNGRVSAELLGAIHSGSALGNPWRVGDGDPIGKFKQHLWKKVQAGDPLVLRELERIVAYLVAHGEATLACWCAAFPRSYDPYPGLRPDGCHADVIAACVVWMASQRQQKESIAV